MGAIVAIIGESGDPELEVRLRRMMERSPYRGTATHCVEHGVAVGIQASDGDASLATEGNWTVAVHGYIGNWAELASSRSWHFPDDATHAARVAVAYEDLGGQLFAKLRGQFSMLIHDRRRHTVLAVRDVIGHKPLYHESIGGRRFIATEVRQVIAGSGVTPEIDIDGLVQEILGEYEDPRRTLVQQVSRLLPNSAKVYSAASGTTGLGHEHYWTPPQEGGGRYEVGQLVVELETLLDRAVDRCLENVPFAVSLSGGIDSTVLWGLLARRIRNGDPVAAQGQAYSHVFPGLECDETERVLETHRFAGTEGVLMDLRSDDLRPDIARLATEVDGFHFGGLPYAERHAQRLSRDGRRIDLTGEGADEWLSGTTSYLADFLLSGNLPAFIRDLFRFQLAPGYRRSRFIYHHTVSPFMRRMRPASGSVEQMPWLHPARNRPAIDLDARISEIDGCRRRSRSRRSLLRRLITVQNWHERESGEQITARYGVERRCPFMDLDVIEFALRIPGRAPNHGLRDKHLLRLVGAGLAPPAVLNRLEKTGYNAAFQPTSRRLIAESDMKSWNLVEQEIVDPNWMRHVTQTSDHDEMTLFNVEVLSVAEVYIRKFSCTS